MKEGKLGGGNFERILNLPENLDIKKSQCNKKRAFIMITI